LVVPGAALMAASVASLIGILMPWASAVSRNGGDAHHRLGVVFGGGGAVLVCGLAMFWAGTRLWRTSRRWVAALASLAASVAGVLSFVVLLYELAMIKDNVAGTLPGGQSAWNVTYGQGLAVAFGAAVVGSLAGIGALRRILRARRRERFPLLRT